MPDKPVRIFLASSDELRADRDAFELYIRQQNDKWLREKNIHFTIDRWETGFGAMSQTRTQDEYNELVKACDLFVILVYSKLGEYSEEEFDTAHQHFKDNSKPLIWTYFKDFPEATASADEAFQSVINFKNKLDGLGHFWNTYSGIEGLTRHFMEQMDILAHRGEILVPPKVDLSLQEKVFLYANPADFNWTETHILPALQQAGIAWHFPRRQFDFDSYTDFKERIRESEQTLILSSKDLSMVERQLLANYQMEEQTEILDRKLRAMSLEGAPMLEGISTVIDCENLSSPERAVNELIVSLKATRVQAAGLPVYLPLASEYIDTSRLPFAIENHLFGRQHELDLLDQAWEQDECNLICFVAQGGMGKSALTGRWVENMRREHFRGAERVFAWSFYSQGTSERVTNADKFISEALRWLGESGFEQLSAWEKGKRLARCIQAQRTLLILDGLEPLQDAGIAERGKVKDPGLFVLLRELAKENPGLCLISTREPLGGLDRYTTQIQRNSLEALSDPAGVALLRASRVRGMDADLTTAVQAFGNHALAIQLLGRYLYNFPEHPIAEAHNIPDLPAVAASAGKHPRRVIAAYAALLADQGQAPAVELLQTFGLFDRPVEVDALQQVIGNINLEIQLKILRREGLLYPESSHVPGIVDCHPLIREHFSEILQTTYPDRWQAAHSQLYAYYKALPSKELPDTLEEMEPLFLAVAHGCKAGRHQEVLYEVYWERMKRKDKHYTTKQLGAFGADLSALAGFFDRVWDQPAANLTEADQAIVLSWVGFRLRALGRLQDTTQPMKAGLEKQAKAKDWTNAASAASNLSELFLSIGEVQQAVEYGQLAVEYADKSGDGFSKEAWRCTHAEALHAAGQLESAASLFQIAEQMQQVRQRGYDVLYSVRGYSYCELLLEQGKEKEVLDRYSKLVSWRLPSDSLLEYALEELTAGKATLNLSQSVEDSNSYLDQAQGFLHQAVAALRKAGTQHHLPRGLLARAAYHRQVAAYPQAHEDLAEVLEIAETSGMRLHLTDYHLESARLALAEDDLPTARTHTEQARVLIEETGYHRRDGELAALWEELG